MTTFSVNTIKGPFESVAADAADVTMTAASTGADVFPCTGREIILVQNSHATNPYTVTISSQVDEKGRTGDITTYSLAAGEIAAFGVGLTNSPGWKNTSTGQITITGSNAAIKIGIIKLPAGYPG